VFQYFSVSVFQYFSAVQGFILFQGGSGVYFISVRFRGLFYFSAVQGFILFQGFGHGSQWVLYHAQHFRELFINFIPDLLASYYGTLSMPLITTSSSRHGILKSP